MEVTSEREAVALARHWRASRRSALALTAVWFVVTFVPPLFARELAFDVLGAPFALWLAAQGAPLVYLLLVWRHERRMARLDAQYRHETAGGTDAAR